MTSLQDERFHTRHNHAAGYITLRSLFDSNPSGGVSGKNHAGLEFPMWTTHFEYAAAMLDAMTDPENQYRLGMNDSQFARVNRIIDDYYTQYPALQVL